MVLKITSNDAYIEFKTKNSDKKVLLDFYADWCGPCRMISPLFEKLAGENAGIVFAKIDVDSVDKAVEEFGISAMPTFKAISSGWKVTGELKGASAEALTKLVTELASA